MNIGSVKYIIKEQYHIPSLETSIIKDSIRLRVVENYHNPPPPVAQKRDDPPLCEGSKLADAPPFSSSAPPILFDRSLNYIN